MLRLLFVSILALGALACDSPRTTSDAGPTDPDSGPTDAGPTLAPVCTGPTDPSCVDQSILELALFTDPNPAEIEDRLVDAARVGRPHAHRRERRARVGRARVGVGRAGVARGPRRVASERAEREDGDEEQAEHREHLSKRGALRAWRRRAERFGARSEKR